MKKVLVKIKSKLIGTVNITGNFSFIWGNATYIRGDVTGISGNVFGISGDVTGISGNVTESELTQKERENGVKIEDLIK